MPTFLAWWNHATTAVPRSMPRPIAYVKTQRPVRLLWTSLFCVTAVLVLAPTSGASAHTDLDDAQRQLERVRQDIRTAERRRSDSTDALAEAEKQVDTITAALREAEIALQDLQHDVAGAEQRLEALRAEQGRREAAVGERAANLYMRGVDLPLVSVLEMVANGEVAERTALIAAAAHADQILIEEAKAGRVRIDAQRQRLEDRRDRLAEVTQQRRRMQATAQELLQDRRLQLAASRERVDALKERERVAQADMARLQEASRTAEGDVREAGERRDRRAKASRSRREPASAGGSWIWPSRGGATSEFGPRWGRMHEGIDIGSGSGSPIYAARSGVVTFAGRMGGYGNLTLIDHDGVVTAYAHQSRIGVGVGDRVNAGEIIGAVGATGNVTGPHLHFEVRDNGQPRDPRRYLP